MRWQDIKKYRDRKPFVPFRLVFTDGRAIDVPAQGTDDIDLQLDARSYKFVQHLNKFGQPYSTGGARY